MLVHDVSSHVHSATLAAALDPRLVDAFDGVFFGDDAFLSDGEVFCWVQVWGVAFGGVGFGSWGWGCGWEAESLAAFFGDHGWVAGGLAGFVGVEGMLHFAVSDGWLSCG